MLCLGNANKITHFLQKRNLHATVFCFSGIKNSERDTINLMHFNLVKIANAPRILAIYILQNY